MNFTDQMHRPINLSTWPPQRIVSLVPSQTEFLADLELDAAVVGITKFCIHPNSWYQEKNRVGGTKTIDFQKIKALQPDLIIGNKEENEQSQIAQLAQEYPVWMSDIYTLEDALEMMHRVGDLTGKTEKAQAIAESVEHAFKQLILPETEPEKAAYLIWRKPYMVAGGHTFIDDMLRHAGFENVFANHSRYPEISLDQLAAAEPTYILLSSEPYPFAAKHLAEIQEICPNARIELVDGELFSWYGSRLLHAPNYFESLRNRLGLLNPAKT
jgi:ABC-type Fe3+-hydroxamate transport system substrate-binding protein